LIQFGSERHGYFIHREITAYKKAAPKGSASGESPPNRTFFFFPKSTRRMTMLFPAAFGSDQKKSDGLG
jgi:hypothetical protein